MDDPTNIISLLKKEAGLTGIDLENCVIDETITRNKSFMFRPNDKRDYFPLDSYEPAKTTITRDVTVKDKEGNLIFHKIFFDD